MSERAELPPVDEHREEGGALAEEQEGGGGGGGEDDAVPQWIRANFPAVRGAQEAAELLVDGTWMPCAASAACDECADRRAAVSCAECALALCWRCADAIHIIPALAAHSVRVSTAAFRAAGDTTASAATVSAADGSSASPPPAAARSDHHASTMSPGRGVLFRAADCGRWPRELLHGVVVAASEALATTAAGVSRAFHRVAWLRGVEALADGSFRASLVLSAPGIAPTAAIGVFRSRLAALRAVATAEALARRARRGQTSPAPAPTRAEAARVVREALDALDRLALARPLRLADDQQFLAAVSSGCWCLDAWLASALGDELASEWLDEEDAIAVAVAVADSAAWPLPKRQLVRHFVLEDRELLLPERERERLLRVVVDRLLFVSMGFAWSRWRRFVLRHRRRERKVLEARAAAVIQRWTRRRWDRGRAALDAAARAPQTMDELERLVRRRQAAARALAELLAARWRRRVRRAVDKWAAAAELSNPHVQRRTASVEHAMRWHPSHGLEAVALPSRLPRVFARATPDGRVKVEDAAGFRQFRETHAGPTAASYWLLRGRVLFGAYPEASAHAKKAGRRQDPVTSVLLEQVDAFVCLAATHELQALEERLGRDDPLKSTAATSTTMTTPWRFERLVRWRQEALMMELRAGERRAERHLELALTAEADAARVVAERQASRRASAQDVADAERDVDAAAARSELSRQHAAAARAALVRQPTRLEFAHWPMAKDGAPGDEESPEAGRLEADVRRVLALVSRLEDLLRAGRSVFAFSVDGRGRTGLLGALLLGRLYGLTASEALERAQRVHDCQPRFHATTSPIPASPTSARHVALVRAALAVSADPIYVPLTRENPAEGFVATRAARRGLLAAPLLREDGALLSPEPDADERARQLAARRGEQRIAATEAAAHRRKLERDRQTRERLGMEAQDRDRGD